MRNRITKKLRQIVIGALGLWSIGSYAVPAKPGIIRVKQKDGTTIAVRLIGDEHSHFYTSADNHLLIRDAQGLFRYAEPDGNGGVRASAMKAADIDKRTASQKAFLEKLDKEALIKAWQKADNAAQHKIKRRQNRVSTGYPTTGEQKGLVILVEYSDVKFNSATAGDDFKRMLTKEGYDENGGTGSAYDYFLESSNGQFKPQFDVYGPVKLDKPMSYYGGNNASGDDEHAHEMIVEACRKLENEVDFSQYDCDKDGTVDNVFVFYAGYGEATSGDPDNVWPHQWELEYALPTPVYVDGLRVNNYACSNELNTNNTMVGIGTFVHEFSHVLGLPDLYATNYSSAFTPGTWSVLDEGPYNNDGRTPPLYSAFERYSVGWLVPKEIGVPESLTLRDISNNEALIIRTDRADEYYILENRQQKGWDKYLPGHGMLVWHIDYDSYIWGKNTVNNTSSHQRVDIIEADNIKSDGTLDGDPFPGMSNITSFTDETTPSMKTWNGNPLNKPITNIKETGGIITFDIAGGHSVIDAPTVAEATEITPISFVANWNKVEKATSYLLSVYKKVETDGSTSTVYLEGMNARNVGNVLKFKVEGLDSETTYYYTVNAVDAEYNETSVSSAEATVVTPIATFEYTRPVALEAEDITLSSFTAKWQPLAGATCYDVEVYRKQFGNPATTGCDFTDGISALPEGWLTNCKSTYSAKNYSGKAIPSARMSANDAFIETQKFDEDIRTLSFWHRGVNAAAENLIIVEGLVGNAWIEIERMAVNNAEGGETNSWGIDGSREMPLDVKAIRLRYSMTGNGSIAIDDIEIGYGGKVTKLFVDGMNPKTTQETQLNVKGVVAGETYYYCVVASDGTKKSMSSKEIRVITEKDATGIGNIAIAVDEFVDIYNMQGVKVAENTTIKSAEEKLPAGVYIAKGKKMTAKIIVR